MPQYLLALRLATNALDAMLGTSECGKWTLSVRSGIAGMMFKNGRHGSGHAMDD
jgi:hypothetical protein